VGVADQVLVLLVPESGDVVQTMKAGLLEGADVFAVNKCDRPGADLLIRSLVAMIEDGVDLHGDLQAPVFGVSALGGEGMDALLDELCVRLDTGRISPRQLGVVEWTARLLGEEVARRASVDLRQRMAEDGDLAAEAEALQKGQTNPYSLVRALLDES
jgi:LAO/AO transport system kinase